MARIREIVTLTPEETYPLRRAVLRDGTASDEVAFDGDELPTSFHLGVRLDGELVAISSWMERRYPDLPDLVGFQLRGMATEPSLRGSGVGAALLTAGIARAGERGADVTWARARVSALSFYLRHGFETRGHEYVDLTTGLAHRDIIMFV